MRKQGRTPHAALDFAVACTGLDRQEAYMLLSIIGELRSAPHLVRLWRYG
jgi:hypothetical protein